MNVHGLSISLNSTQPVALFEFYRDRLHVKANPDMGEMALMAGSTPLLLDGHSELAGPAQEPARTLLNFLVDDVGQEQQRLEAAGVRFLGKPSADVISFSTYVDPDGNYGQIFSMPGVPGDGSLAVGRHSGDPERLRLFMRDVVGLSDDLAAPGSPFIVGGTAIYISSHSEVHGPSTEPARLLISFFVDDLAAEQRRIEGHGVQFIRTAGREDWGGLISTFPDPDGNYLQLIGFRPE
ncbi:MAG: VOC family protein [Dehalococcoidia bacterium]